MFKNNPFLRRARRVPYIAGGTTWTCNTCKQQAWVEGDLRGCGCGDKSGPRPLIADDPEHWSNRPFGEDPIADRFRAKPAPDPRDELIETLQQQLSLSTEIALRQSAAITAARHLMRVFASTSAIGPVFKLNDEHDDASIAIIQHAVLALQAELEGAEVPQFCLPERTH